MRRPAQRKGTGRVSSSGQWVAPTGGWRTDVTLADMPKDAAFQLDNFFPETNRVRARYGSNIWASGLGASVKTIIPYAGATPKLFGAAGGNIYDITAGGAVGAAVVSGKSSARWSVQQYVSAAGSFLLLCNGVDTPLQYDGTTWSVSTITGSGLTPANLSVVCAYRSRNWFIEKNTTNVWYLPTDAITGTAVKLPVGGNMKWGGTLVAMGVWTVPNQDSLYQSLVMISSEGEIIVFAGSDPTTATGFRLIGTFKVGKPLGFDRCLLQVGSDLAIMTTDGIIPISQAVKLDRGATDLGAITKPIAPTWLQTVLDNGTTSDEWQLTGFPKRRMAVVNLPESAGAYQYVMNTQTGAWCRFFGLASVCWGVWNDRLFFGRADGNVCEAEVGSSDSGGTIDCLMSGSWQTYGDGISPKYSTLIGANLQSGPSTAFAVGASFNYAVTVPQSFSSQGAAQTVGVWDVSNWDQSYFVGTTLSTRYASSTATGVSIAPTIRALIAGDTVTISEAGIIGGTVLFQRGQPI